MHLLSSSGGGAGSFQLGGCPDPLQPEGHAALPELRTDPASTLGTHGSEPPECSKLAGSVQCRWDVNQTFESFKLNKPN